MRNLDVLTLFFPTRVFLFPEFRGIFWLFITVTGACFSSFIMPKRSERKLSSDFETLLEDEKFLSLAELAAGLGHELNNPLGVISGRAQLMLRRENDPLNQRDLADICRQVQRAQDMITELRTLACPPLPEMEPLSMKWFCSLISRVINDLNEDSLPPGIKIHTLYPPDNDENIIRADLTQLYSLFHALLLNSVRAIGESGDVTITVKKRARYLAAEIKDTGSGISPEIERRIFDPFYSSYQNGRGLGFGLTRARRIALAHAGSLRYAGQGNDGHGAVFVLKIPLIPAVTGR